MNNIVIIYPELFNCYEKFSRKVIFLIQNITDFSVSYVSDPNGFIEKLFNETHSSIKIEQIKTLESSHATHGVVFDDGEEFPKDILYFKSKKIPLKIINIDITRVVNIKKETKYQNPKSTPKYEYIGRGSYWGNPHSMHENGNSREEVIRKFKYDFDYEKFPNKKKSEVYKLAGKRLGCFCKPLACHGDVLADYLNSWDDGK